MKKLFLFCLVLCQSILLMAQKPIKLFKETRQLPNGKFQLVEKNKKGDILIVGTLSSINPEVRDGEFNFYDADKIFEAKGFYTENVPSGIWNYYNKQGEIVKSINCDKTIQFLNADTIKPKEVFLVVEQMPDFRISDSDTIPSNEPFMNTNYFRKYVNENLVYPIYAAKKNISGRIFVQFIITETGKVCNLKLIISSGNLDLNMEALRLISESPLWKPGRQRNIPVAVVYTFPITFVLN